MKLTRLLAPAIAVAMLAGSSSLFAAPQPPPLSRQPPISVRVQIGIRLRASTTSSVNVASTTALMVLGRTSKIIAHLRLRTATSTAIRTSRAMFTMTTARPSAKATAAPSTT